MRNNNRSRRFCEVSMIQNFVESKITNSKLKAELIIE
jgi:hypothetical protein